MEERLRNIRESAEADLEALTELLDGDIEAATRSTLGQSLLRTIDQATAMMTGGVGPDDLEDLAKAEAKRTGKPYKRPNKRPADMTEAELTELFKEMIRRQTGKRPTVPKPGSGVQYSGGIMGE